MALKILLVDDDSDILEFQKSYFTRHKYEVLTATNSREALAAIKDLSPDIVFCDVRLEYDDAGLTILEEAKKLKPDLIFYLVTGLMGPEIKERGLALGAKDVLSKPFTNQDIEKLIKESFPAATA